MESAAGNLCASGNARSHAAWFTVGVFSQRGESLIPHIVYLEVFWQLVKHRNTAVGFKRRRAAILRFYSLEVTLWCAWRISNFQEPLVSSLSLRFSTWNNASIIILVPVVCDCAVFGARFTAFHPFSLKDSSSNNRIFLKLSTVSWYHHYMCFHHATYASTSLGHREWPYMTMSFPKDDVQQKIWRGEERRTVFSSYFALELFWLKWVK